jgi:succinylarginine dihydrolase
MNNGGGPACLRLRAVLNQDESQNVHPGVLLTEKCYSQIGAWINRHYRDKLELADLGDPKFLEEVRTALDNLTEILDLGSIYSFQ